MEQVQERFQKEKRHKVDTLDINLHDSLGTLKQTISGFGVIDTTYVEPHHYNWSLMPQSTFNYDVYWRV